MGWAVNNLTLRGVIESILKGIGDIRNDNCEMVGGIDGNNWAECSY